MKLLLTAFFGLAVAGLTAFSADESSSTAAPAKRATGNSANRFVGKVAETTNAASYTYVLVDTGDKKVWIAAPQLPVKVGDSVTVPDAMPMPNYHSKALNRDFAVVYFADGVQVQGTRNAEGGTGKAENVTGSDLRVPSSEFGGLPPNHPPLSGVAAKPSVDLSGIKKAAGGKTVEEIITGKAQLQGKPVKVRGKVVKYNARILGKNWLHIRDGSGQPGSDDLMVMSATPVKVGDTVLVSGKVSTDRDFGAGYKYAVMIEDAEVVVE